VLQHVALEVGGADVEACAAFWALVGFERVEPPETLRDRAVWLARGPTQIHLLLIDSPTAPPEGHAAVVVEDYEAALARLRNAGFDVAPRAEHWDAARAFVRDPAGHRVELMAAPPPSAPRSG
jgi:catechol 2,3-dioxygenase-like lactoylglutathione lyase family enzyme